jgi:hypothetical protein
MADEMLFVRNADSVSKIASDVPPGAKFSLSM